MSEPLVFSIPLRREGDADHSSGGATAPLEFPTLQILLHQAPEDDNYNVDPVLGIDASGDSMHDTGFVMWPSSVMLARYLMQNPSIVHDCPGNIIELGAGCGLVGLTVARMLQNQRVAAGEQPKEDNELEANGVNVSTVIMTDYNPAARDNLKRNARLNKVDHVTSVVGLDFFDQAPGGNDDDYKTDIFKDSATWMDMEGKRQPQVPLILGADIIAYSNDGEMVAHTLDAALLGGGQAFIVGPEERYRFGLEGFSDACRSVGLNVSEETIQLAADGSTQQQRDQLARDIEQTGGSKLESGCQFTMYSVIKPCKG